MKFLTFMLGTIIYTIAETLGHTPVNCLLIVLVPAFFAAISGLIYCLVKNLELDSYIEVAMFYSLVISYPILATLHIF